MRNFVIVSNVENNKDKLSGFSTGVLKCYIFVNYKMHTKKEKTKKRKKKEWLNNENNDKTWINK